MGRDKIDGLGAHPQVEQAEVDAEAVAVVQSGEGAGAEVVAMAVTGAVARASGKYGEEGAGAMAGYRAVFDFSDANVHEADFEVAALGSRVSPLPTSLRTWVADLGCGLGLRTWVADLGCGLGMRTWDADLGCGLAALRRIALSKPPPLSIGFTYPNAFGCF